MSYYTTRSRRNRLYKTTVIPNLIVVGVLFRRARRNWDVGSRGSFLQQSTSNHIRCLFVTIVLYCIVLYSIISTMRFDHYWIIASLLLLAPSAVVHSKNSPAPTSCASDPQNAVCVVDVPEHKTLDPQCRLYMAPSSIPNAGWGVYTTKNLDKGSVLETNLALIPIHDHYKTMPYHGNQRFTNWLGYVWGREEDAFYHSSQDSFPTIVQHAYQVNEGLSYATSYTFTNDEGDAISTLRPGLFSLLNSHAASENVMLNADENFVTSTQVTAGTELVLNYGTKWHKVLKKNLKSQHRDPHYLDLDYYNAALDWTDLPTTQEKYNSINPETWHKRTGERGIAENDDYVEPPKTPLPNQEPKRRSPLWIQRNGYCLERLEGNVAQISLKQGEIIITTPTLAIPRNDLNIYEAYETTSSQQKWALNDKIIGKEPLLEYTYGDARSDLLLFPYGPHVHEMENAEGKTPNVQLRFHTEDAATKELLQLHPIDVVNSTKTILLDFVALTDIEQGDELILDYGTPHESERRVPSTLYPPQWLHTELEYKVQDVKKPLEPNELQQLVWEHNQEPVTTHAYRLGLAKGLSQKMLEYTEDLGIVDLYKKLLNEDVLESDDWYVFNATTPSTQPHEEWFAQRYKSKEWAFNMHYVAAWSESARVSFLRGLNQAGFGQALETIGTELDMEELTCFHVSYMGVSQCENSMMHTDIYATDYKGFNIIFPIMVVPGSKEELDIQAYDANVVTSVNYEYDHAIVMGDWGYHKTSPNSFTNDDVRIVVGIYCAEMTPSNLNQLAHIYNGEDPAPFMNQFTSYEDREVHWSKEKGVTLPE